MCGTNNDCECNNGPTCCQGKPCGDTCISVDEICHEGPGSASCSDDPYCNCNSCDSQNQVCFPACDCGNPAAGDCSIGSCGNCCDDEECPRHG